VTADLSIAPILVVDDDAGTRMTIQWALEDAGFVVETALDGRQALEQIASSRPALVVLDIRLPIADGTAVADGLRQSYGIPPPIVLVTGDDRAEEKARRVGAYAYLLKPFDLDDLVSVVRRGLGQGSSA
jgi:CheY-like chemotaxis protein